MKKRGKKVILESPFNPTNGFSLQQNINYGRACMHDCFLRGEYPLASHLLYTQKGILDDRILEERNLGIEAGLVWGEHAEYTVAYIDLGISNGMKYGIQNAINNRRLVEVRNIEDQILKNLGFVKKGDLWIPKNI